MLPEEIKPLYAVAWIDYSKLKETPGLTELEIRAKLMTREKYEKNIDDLEKIINKKIYNPYSLEYEKLNPPKEQNQESNQEGQAQPNTEEDSSKDYLGKKLVLIYEYV